MFALFEPFGPEATVFAFEAALGVGNDCLSGPVFVELSVLLVQAAAAKAVNKRAVSFFVPIK